jgi:hypothetical protein
MNPLDLIQPLNRIQIADIIATAFPATRPARSEAYRLGVEKALETASAGDVLPELYHAGTPRFDAYHAGVVEGRALWARHIAAKANLPHRQLAPANASDVLAAELIHASTIITTLINHITRVQLADVRNVLLAEGVIGQTNMVSRAPERLAALVAAGFATSRAQA